MNKRERKIKKLARKTNRRLGEPFGKRLSRGIKRTLKVMVLSASVPAIAFAVFFLYHELTLSPYLSVDEIIIEGNSRITEEEILRVAGISGGMNILTVNSGYAKEGLLAHPYIEEVKISRKLPGTVRIEIIEREPYALVLFDELRVMDKKGIVFKEYEAMDSLDLPVITGVSSEEEFTSTIKSNIFVLLRALDHGEHLRSEQVSEIHVDMPLGYYVYTLEEGSRIEFGRGGFEGKVRDLDKIIVARGGTLEGVTSVDLNNERGVLLKLTADLAKRGGIT